MVNQAAVCYNHHMKLYSWNVNGIRAVQKKALLEPFIAKHDPDVLCIQETKAQPDQVEAEFATLYPQYHQYWHSADKKGYAGTAIFSKTEPLDAVEGLPANIVEQYKLTDNYGDTTREGRVLVVEYAHIYVATVYTPNAKEDLSRIPMRQEWDPAFLTYMQQLQAVKPVVFCGDLNVAHTELDLARPKANVGKKGFTTEERQGFDAMVDAGFIDTLRVFHKDTPDLYTWWSHWGGARERNVGWRIDYFMLHNSLASLLQSARIHPGVLGSDHCPVSVELALELS